MPLTAGFGYQLYAGNNPMNKSGGAIEGQDYKRDDFAGFSNVYERDVAMRKAAIRFIAEHPGRFAEMAALKFLRMWRVWPVNAGYANWPTILVSIVAFLPVLLLNVLELYYVRRALLMLSPILLFALGYTAINMVLAGTIRYRLPLEPFMLIFAAAAASRLLGNPVAVQMAAKFPSPEAAKGLCGGGGMMRSIESAIFATSTLVE